MSRLSMEEWKYAERHKELVMENHRPADGFHSPVSPPDSATKNGTENLTEQGGKYLMINNSGQYEAATNPSRTSRDKGNLVVIYPTAEHSQAEYPSIDIKEEPASWEEGNLRDVKLYPPPERKQTEYPPGRIKEAPASREEGNLPGRTRTDHKPFKCNECGKCLSTTDDLFKHYRIHAREKAFTCNECGKGFSSHDDLVLHEGVHTAEKPFQCGDCGKRYIHAARLETHKRIHTGDKQFKCDECGKCFARASSIATHKWIHTGVKPFQCDVCGKGFTRGSALANHKVTHEIHAQ